MSEFEPEMIDSATEEGQARIAELKAASAAEKTRKKRRSEAELICDGLMEIKARFEAVMQEHVNGSVDGAIERGEVVTAQECKRRVEAAKAEVRAELRKLLDDGK